MKKLCSFLLFSIIFFGLTLVFSKNAFASCQPKVNVSCPGTQIQCWVSGEGYSCCNNNQECTDIGGTVGPGPTSPSVFCDTNLWCDCPTSHAATMGTKLKTAIGCIPVLSSKEDFLSFTLTWAVGIGGGIAFLLIIYAGFMIMTSSGNPERLKAGQELLTSAISGLILLIFSVVILRIIGVNILQIPGFAK